MPKRQISGRSGKQLYLNKIFNRGMLYTSSEMQEGVVKAISNYDITPTGDGAIPRLPYSAVKTDFPKYTYPVKFQQAKNMQHLVSFDNVISEGDFVNDNIDTANKITPGVSFRSRGAQSMTELDFNSVVDVDGNFVKPLEVEIYGEERLEDEFRNDATTNTGHYIGQSMSDHNIHPIPVLSEEPLLLIARDEIQVIDGDTIKHTTTNKIYRFLGIDTPELNQEWGLFAKFIVETYLDYCIYIWVQEEPKKIKDVYGRSVVSIIIQPIGTTQKYNLSEMLLKLGVAKVRFIYDQYFYINDLVAAQNYAKSIDKNIWSEGAQTDPFYHYKNNYVDLEVLKDINALNVITPKEFEFINADIIEFPLTEYDALHIEEEEQLTHLIKVTVNNVVQYNYTSNPINLLNHNEPNTHHIDGWWYDSNTQYFHFGRDMWDIYKGGNSVEILLEFQTKSFSKEIYIETVKINHQKLVSHKLTNEVDFIEYIYLDNLDGIGFIGRIVYIDNNTLQPIILYKGLIIIRCLTSTEKTISFKLKLPENGFEGHKPSIAEAAMNGYNLYNSQLLKLNNTTENSSTLIHGIVVSNPENAEEIITQAVPGAKVNIHGIINEGYFNETSTIPIVHNDFNFEVFGKVKSSIYVNMRYVPTAYTNSFKQLSFVDRKIQAVAWDALEPGDTTYKNPDGPNYLNMPIVLPDDFDKEITLSHINPLVSMNFASKEYIEEAYKFIFEGGTGGNFYITEVSNNVTMDISFKMKTPIEVNLTSQLLTFVETATVQDIKFNTTFIEGLFSFGIRAELSLSKRNISLSFQHNLKDIKKDCFGSVRDGSNVLPDRVFVSYFEKSFDDVGWTNIVEPFEHYKLNSNDKLEAVSSLPNYISYKIEENRPIVLRYRLVPSFKLSDGKFLNSEFFQYTSVYPRFSIGAEWRTIDNDELQRNISLRNATRLLLFNRQVCLYGNYIGSNVLQFSMFEDPFYYAFPYYNVGIDEKIIHVHKHKDNLIVFGQNNLYILSGSMGSALDFRLFKVYENLSILSSDIKSVISIGNNVAFLNKQIGYVMVPNKYTEAVEDISIFKLTEPISNLLQDPEKFIRDRKKLPFHLYNIANLIANFNTFVEDNILTFAVSYRFLKQDKIALTPFVEDTMVVMYRYNQVFRYWSLYDLQIVDRITANYICEPQLGVQFLGLKNGQTQLMSIIDFVLPLKFTKGRIDVGLEDLQEIETYIDSGYLSVDTANEKRFKDLLFEMNNHGGANLHLYCNFFIDGQPVVITEVSTIILHDNETVTYESQEAVGTTFEPFHGFTLDGSYFTIADRVRIRYPVWGKGRMPSFTLTIKANEVYEFLNFSVIYKEKSIERRR